MNVNEHNAADVARVQKALLAPFHPKAVKFKPTMVKNNRALAMAYIDARLVMDRLDKAVGIGGWKTEYVRVGDDSVECRLSVRIGGEWVTKADVGSTSEQPDAGDRMKAAYSDALKRAAVQFGVGRYLYRLPSQWVDYDPVKKRITTPPKLPAWACPENPDETEAADDPPPEPERAEPSAWARALVGRLRAAARRDEGGPVWQEYESAGKAGKVTAADKDALDAAFAEFGKRFPKPAKA